MATICDVGSCKRPAWTITVTVQSPDGELTALAEEKDLCSQHRDKLCMAIKRVLKIDKEIDDGND